MVTSCWKLIDMNTMPIFPVLLYAGKTWAVKADIHDWSELTNTMIRWIISAKVCERIPMSDLGNHMGISSIEDTILLTLFIGLVLSNRWMKTDGLENSYTSM